MRGMRILGGNCAIYIGIFFNGTFDFLQYIITNTTLYTSTVILSNVKIRYVHQVTLLIQATILRILSTWQQHTFKFNRHSVKNKRSGRLF